MASFSGVHVVIALVIVLIAVAMTVGEGSEASEAVNHAVGGDRGWDLASDIPRWSADKIFRAGDSIWFAYSVAQESIAELGSKEEFESCDLANPIRLYTGGLDRVGLEEEGPRYFVSGRAENCRKGLKLHVRVLPHGYEPHWLVSSIEVVANGPQPSGSSRLLVSYSLVLTGLVVLGFSGI